MKSPNQVFGRLYSNVPSNETNNSWKNIKNKCITVQVISNSKTSPIVSER